jgi:hypothetical protein
MTPRLRLALLLTLWGGVSGCALGPRVLESGRLRYNEAVKKTTEQQLLLNIVRLRYGILSAACRSRQLPTSVS